MLGPMTYVVCHDIGAAELLPSLYTETSQCTLPHAIVDKLPPTFRCQSLSGEHGDDFLVLCNDVGILEIAAGLNVCKDTRNGQIIDYSICTLISLLDSLICSVYFSQPTWRFGQEWEADHEEDAWHELDSPSSSERSRLSWNEGAAIADEEPADISLTRNNCHAVDLHKKNTPFNCQLLNNDDGTTLGMFRDLGEVHGDLRGRNSDSHTIENTTSNQHAAASHGNLEGSSDKPPDAGKHEAVATPKVIRCRAGHDGSDDGASSQCAADCSLSDSIWIVEEVTEMLLAGRHMGEHQKTETELLKRGSTCRYCVDPIMALMELISKPNSMPPIVAMIARK